MALRPHDIKRAAENYLAQHAMATQATVAVLWQRTTDADDAFCKRVTTARTRLPANQLLVAVCGFDVIPPMRGVCIVELPPVMLGLFDKPARYRVCYGGRGAGRSWSFARALLVRSLQSRIRILCGREFQNSIADSVHALLSDQIELLGLGAYFEVQNTAILGRNGSEFIFSGVRSNITRVKSLEGVSIAYIEEAAGVSANSWETLIPTVRAPGSEFFVAFNPDLESDPTYQRFVVHPPDTAIVLKTTHRDNPRFPEPLQAEADYLKRVDLDAYAHVWEGGCRTHTDAQIFRGKYFVESFEPQAGWSGPYFGADWGFSQDPTTLIKCWINERTLYLEHEAYGVGIDIDRTPAMFDAVPGARAHTIRADSARPETISFMQRHGYDDMESVSKWSGSVEDGIAHLRSYERIVVHPRCTHAADEMRLYSFKVDRLTGDILPEPVDKNNHVVDAIRYALQPMIKGGGASALLEFYKLQGVVEAEKKAELAKRPGVITADLQSPWHTP